MPRWHNASSLARYKPFASSTSFSALLPHGPPFPTKITHSLPFLPHCLPFLNALSSLLFHVHWPLHNPFAELSTFHSSNVFPLQNNQTHPHLQILLDFATVVIRTTSNNIHQDLYFFHSSIGIMADKQSTDWKIFLSFTARMGHYLEEF